LSWYFLGNNVIKHLWTGFSSILAPSCFDARKIIPFALVSSDLVPKF
jgi:hypothetical protein